MTVGVEDVLSAAAFAVRRQGASSDILSPVDKMSDEGYVRISVKSCERPMKESYREPIYAIGIAAKLLGVCPATLRIWERKGLIKPKRIRKHRFYSRCDLDRLGDIKELSRKKGINLEGVRRILKATRCWEIKKCRPKEREVCPVYEKYGEK